MLSLLATGCTMPYGQPCLRPPNAVFPGIADAFKDADGENVPAIDLLLVHGMGTTTYQWVADRVGVLARELGFHWDGKEISPIDLVNGAMLYKLTLDDGARRLDISAVLWSPITEKAKKSLCYDVTRATLSCGETDGLSKDTRARINALLKNQLMDDRLSDVTFYLGAAGGSLIRAAIEEALLRSLSTDSMSLAQVEGGATPVPKRIPVFLLSESLGSKIVVDSLDSLESIHSATKFAQVERSQIDSLFLLANQIPILSLGETVDLSGVSSPKSSLRQFIRKRSDNRHEHEKGKPEKPLRIVAFSDPNDVFSYQLSQRMFPGDSVVVSNVVDSNGWTYVGVAENPVTAHTGYIDKRDVARARYVLRSIARGSSILPDPHATHCGA